jgi:small ubiquitin-related modifier
LIRPLAKYLLSPLYIALPSLQGVGPKPTSIEASYNSNYNSHYRERMAEQKPDIKGEPITIKIRDGEGKETVFKVKGHTKFSKIMEAFAGKAGVQLGSVRFLYDGNTVRPEDTPDSLGMEDNDAVDCLPQQTGGTSL